jgi:hypothetical protein
MQHNILRFDIPMDNSERVNFIYSFTNLSHKPGHFLFRHGLALSYLMVKLSAHSSFQENINIGLIIKEAVHFDDM